MSRRPSGMNNSYVKRSEFICLERKVDAIIRFLGIEDIEVLTQTTTSDYPNLVVANPSTENSSNASSTASVDNHNDWSVYQQQTSILRRPPRRRNHDVTRNEFLALEMKLDKLLRVLETDGPSHGQILGQVSNRDHSGLSVRNPSCASSSIASSANSLNALGQILKNQENIFHELREMRNAHQNSPSDIQDSNHAKTETSRPLRDQLPPVGVGSTEEILQTQRQTMVFTIQDVVIQRSQKAEMNSKQYRFPQFPCFLYYLTAQFTDMATSFYLRQEPMDARNPPLHLPDYFSQLEIRVVLKVSNSDGEMEVLSSKMIALRKVYDKWNLGAITTSDLKKKGYVSNDEMTVFCVFEYSWQFDSIDV